MDQYRAATRDMHLAQLLTWAVEHDTNYHVRFRHLLAAMQEASALGYEVGFRIDPSEPEWPVLFIELPTGQVSWHMPQHARPWDGHTTDEKFERIARYAKQLDPPASAASWRRFLDSKC